MSIRRVNACTLLLAAALFVPPASSQVTSWASTPLYHATAQSSTNATVLVPQLAITLPGLVQNPVYSSSAAAGVSAAMAAAALSAAPFALRVGVALNYAPPALALSGIVSFVANSPGYYAWTNATPGTATRIDATDIFWWEHPNQTQYTHKIPCETPRTREMLRVTVGRVGPWVLSAVASQGNISIEYYAVRLPDSLVAATDSTQQALYTLYNLGLDMALYDCTLTEKRSAYMRFTVPIEPYTHQVVSLSPTLPKKSVSQKLWTWLSPFSWDLWVLLLGTVMLSGFVYHKLEYDDPILEDPSELDDEAALRMVSYFSHLYHCAYLSFLSLIGTINAYPSTNAARMFLAVKAFCTWVRPSPRICSRSRAACGNARAVKAHSLTQPRC